MIRIIAWSIIRISLGVLACSSAFAQSQGTVTNHAIPVGRGPGVSGFGSIIPSNTGYCLTSNGLGTDPSFQPCGSGVSSITAGTGLSGGTITSSGTISVLYGTTAGTATQGNDTRISGALQATNNLSDLANLATARANLGVVPLAGGTMTGPLILSADPTTNFDAATKQYVDSVALGIQVKPVAAVATTVNITLSGEQTIDGVLTSTSEVLVKNQSAPAQNGIYTSASGAWTRIASLDTWSEALGAFVFISGGTTQANTQWIAQVSAGGTIGTTAMPWAQFGAVTAYSAGTGLTLTGTAFSITAPISIALGGTNATTAAGALTNLGAVPLAGGTMTGFLTLSADPTANLHAATKQYVDAHGGGGFTGELWANDPTFGATCNGSTDDTAAFQALITAAISTQKAARFYGTCVVATSASLTITNGMSLCGVYANDAGYAGASLLVAGGAHDVFSVTTQKAVNFCDFQINMNGHNSNSAIVYHPPGPADTWNDNSVMNNITVQGGGYGVKLLGNRLTVMNHVLIFQAVTAALLIDNQVSSSSNACDNGDHLFSNNWFGGFATADGVVIRCGGGIKMTGSKVFGNRYAIEVSVGVGSVQDSASTSFVFTGNSLEDVGLGLFVHRGDPSHTSSNPASTIDQLVFTGNEITCHIFPPAVCIGVNAFDYRSSPSTFFQNFSVTGNVWLAGASGSTFANLSYARYGLFGGNNLDNLSGSVSGVSMYQFTSGTVSSIMLAPNMRSEPGTWSASSVIGTDIIAAFCVNPATNTQVTCI